MKIEPLGKDELADLSEGLTIAALMLGQPKPLSIAQVQLLYDQAMERPSVPVEEQVALGLAFGETIADLADFEWVKASDDYGDELALSPIGQHIACYPISMIQKRLEDREHVDLARLRTKIIEAITDKVSAGGVFSR